MGTQTLRYLAQQSEKAGQPVDPAVLLHVGVQFVKDIAGDLRIHLHGVEHGGRLWREHLRFRDLQSADDARRSEYEALKRRLAIAHAGDKAAYTVEKGAYIRSLLSAMEE